MRSSALIKNGHMRVNFAILVIFIIVFSMSAAYADCKHTLVLSNWRACAIGPLSETGGDADWAAVPAWTRDRTIQTYFYGEPRLLANHGLCNEKFHRVVLCLPGWEENRDDKACWYRICAGNRVRR